MSVTRVGKVSPPRGVPLGGSGPEMGAGGPRVTSSHLLLCLISAWHRLYSHIQLASKLTSGCDYSLFKV